MLKTASQKHIAKFMLFITFLIVMICLALVNVPVASAAAIPQNPRTIENETMVWDCVYFGNYPQSEVKSSEEIYDTLQNSTDWDNDEIVIDGVRYCRIEKWHDDPTSVDPSIKVQHYFKYEPIKWRVLSTNNNELFLLADQNLDIKSYNPDSTTGGVTWAVSTIRSWLNGYGSNMNKEQQDYTSSGFINSAFTKSEQDSIPENLIKNQDNPEYGTIGGNDTKDKIFLLSIDEVSNVSYGFFNSIPKNTESMNTAYVSNKISSYDDQMSKTGRWWLRSPGKNSSLASRVGLDGSISESGWPIGSQEAVRPALYLNLNSDTWKYAGTTTFDFGKYIPILKSITVSKSKKDYTVNDRLTIEDVKVTAFYSDGTKKRMYSSDGFKTNASQIDMSTPGTKSLIVTYEQTNPMHIVKTATIPITVTKAAAAKSKAATVTKPKKVTIRKVTSAKKGTLTATWKRDSKATGYQLTISQNKKFTKGKKSVTISKNKTTKKTIKKLKSKKTYYAKVRAYKKSGSKKVYGAYSKVKKVKVK